MPVYIQCVLYLILFFAVIIIFVIIKGIITEIKLIKIKSKEISGTIEIDNERMKDLERKSEECMIFLEAFERELKDAKLYSKKPLEKINNLSLKIDSFGLKLQKMYTAKRHRSVNKKKRVKYKKNLSLTDKKTFDNL
jgi:hypothetical protein